jgi:hypothetical protein
MFLWVDAQGVVSLGHMAALSLVFKGISMLLSIVVVLFASPPQVYKRSYFTISLPAFVIVIILYYGHSNWVEMNTKCYFDLHLFCNQGS